LHKPENEKNFKEPMIKSGSSHLWVIPFFNSEILLIYLPCNVIVFVYTTVNILKNSTLAYKLYALNKRLREYGFKGF